MGLRGLGRGLGQGMAQLGQMMYQDSRQQDAEERRRQMMLEAEQRRFDFQKQLQQDRFDAQAALEAERNATVPIPYEVLNSLPGGFNPVATAPGNQYAGARVSRGTADQMLRDMFANAMKPQPQPWSPQTDIPLLRDEVKRTRDAADGGGVNLVDAQRLSDLWAKNRPVGDTWDLLSYTGQDAPARALFEQLVTSGVPVPQAAQRVEQELAYSLPEGYSVYRSDDGIGLVQNTGRSWNNWDGKTELDMDAMTQLSRQIVHGATQAQVQPTAPAGGDRPAETPEQAPMGRVELPGGRMAMVQLNGRWVMVDEKTGDYYEPTPDAMRYVEGQ